MKYFATALLALASITLADNSSYVFSQVPTWTVTEASDITVFTTVVDTITIPCPSPTTFTTNGETYTIIKPTTLTITNCPCTLTRTGAPQPFSSRKEGAKAPGALGATGVSNPSGASKAPCPGFSSRCTVVDIITVTSTQVATNVLTRTLTHGLPKTAENVKPSALKPALDGTTFITITGHSTVTIRGKPYVATGPTTIAVPPEAKPTASDNRVASTIQASRSAVRSTLPPLLSNGQTKISAGSIAGVVALAILL